MPKIIEPALSYKIMGILFKVHQELGGRYQEKYYQRAVARGLEKARIKFQKEIAVDLRFENSPIGKYFLDFLIEEKIVLEVKTVPRLTAGDFKQISAYLKAKNLELGIIANFRGPKLTYKRILNPDVCHSDKFGSKFGTIRMTSDLYTTLAKQAVETWIKSGKMVEVPKDLPKEILEKRAGVFVSLHTKSGELRGCIGTFIPTKPSLAQEIIANAISSATSDPRFPPVSEEELPDLVYSVDILSAPKNVSKVRDLDVKRYGLIVSTSDGRRGLLLPDIPGIKTPEEQFRICCLKAGISPEEKVRLQTFTVERHE
ncbi:MAG: AmmeMemoRadiSam system protein A [Patescibacteria group bacterium]